MKKNKGYESLLFMNLRTDSNGCVLLMSKKIFKMRIIMFQFYSTKDFYRTLAFKLLLVNVGDTMPALILEIQQVLHLYSAAFGNFIWFKYVHFQTTA
jgi:hypothetical protein